MIVKDRGRIMEISKTQTYSRFLEHAPYVVVALAEEDKSSHWLEDCSCAIMLLLLEAHSLGLGACWNAVYLPESQEREDYVRRILNIPERFRVIANIGIGYPEEKASPKRVKSPQEVIFKVI